MFEKRKLERLRMDALNAVAERSDGEASGRFPDFFGLYETQVAGSLVTVGGFLLDGVVHKPPVQRPHQKGEEKLIIQNLSVDGMVQAWIFLTHAVVRWCLVRDEYLAKTGKDEDAVLLRPREEQMLGLLERFFPISEEDGRVLDEAATPYRDLDLTNETIKDREPVSSSGWMNYLRDPELWGETAEGQTPEERREELLDTHFFVSDDVYRAVASRRAIKLAVGSAYDETKSSAASIEHDMGYEALQGQLATGSMWKAMGTDAYYDMLTTFAEQEQAEKAV